MTISITVKHGCLAALIMAVTLPGWSATRFSPSAQPLGSIAPLVLSNPDLSKNTTKGYRPWFENGSWQGDLVEYNVTKEGGLSTTVNFGGTSPTSAGSNWSALDKFAAASATYWDDTRKIITFDGTTQVPFRFTDSNGIGAANRALLDAKASEGNSKILNFVRGDRSNEFPSGAQLRLRTSILGDIIHSKPVYVGPPNDTRTENDYAAWAAARSNRSPRVYVGANDGMLHVFNAADGSEVYAYVPSMLMGKLSKLITRPYPHEYFVDGEMTVRDAWFDGDWHTLLVGTLGAGGRGFFGLDITDPDLSSETANTGDNKKVLFEFRATGDNDLGDSFSRPVIAKLNDGDWYVIIGNGYNSVNGVAKLYLVNLDTLAVNKLTTSSGTAANPNGLSSPSLLDIDRNGTADVAYAGDIDGNLWKFDLTSSSAGDWDEAYGRPLHPTAGTQPITQAPQIALHPNYGYMVYFATGRIYTADDLNDTSVQAMYGIWDKGTPPPDTQSLLEQTWDGPKTYDYTDTDGDADEQTIAIYNPDAGTPNWANQHGWKINFPAGYRVLQPVQVRANRVKATVYKPVAGQQGENWLLEAVLADGGPNPTTLPIYDLNVDQDLDAADLYNNGLVDGDEEWHVPMIWRQADGIMSQVTIGYIGPRVDTLFINYLQQPYHDSCAGICSKGFQGGHIDVDTWLDSVALGGKATQHDHEYDKKAGRVYIDMFDLNVDESVGENTDNRKSVTGQVEIDSTGNPSPSSTIADNTEFIVLVANADFSPGSTLQIGTKKWNVFEYQRQIQDALRNWDPSVAGSVPTDADGASLVFTWGAIKAAGGTISHIFDDKAIVDGGLHPTQTGCVNKDATGDGRNTYDLITKEGRWRNGALTTQLVKKSYFTTDPVNPALAKVDIQKPRDMPAKVYLANDNPDDTNHGTPTGIDLNGDGDTLDTYEQYGGLLAKTGSEHIWESALFWHFGNLSSLAGLGKPCYGDTNWEAAVKIERSNDPLTAALAELGLEGVTAETIADRIAELESCSQNAANAACRADYKLLKKLYESIEDFTRVPNGGDDETGSGNNGQRPVVVPGGSTGAGLVGDGGDGSRTQGVDFEAGRMSWTDIDDEDRH
jgi:PilY1 beta-propeller domain